MVKISKKKRRKALRTREGIAAGVSRYIVVLLTGVLVGIILILATIAFLPGLVAMGLVGVICGLGISMLYALIVHKIVSMEKDYKIYFSSGVFIGGSTVFIILALTKYFYVP
ncbi:hypothetical protein J4526_02145 [Desulfurococcaceae archaeon MEX13E-LK6-19]|nr:hypothetical protein J4526_02145 [Desulfurococcaceae archaeon MEX13E-LK6-19]